MRGGSQYLDALVRELSRLPGIGPKSASRLAFHILKMKKDDVARLALSMTDLREHIRACQVCGGIADGPLCHICENESRDRTVICVVEEQKDALTIEHTGGFTGLFHVLGGVLSPLDGIGPDDLSIARLVERCRSGPVREVIIATNPTIEGDATALYLARLLKDMEISVMRIAHGLPVGSDMDFADSATLLRSIQARTRM
jgi:recombination protein RecR